MAQWRIANGGFMKLDGYKTYLGILMTAGSTALTIYFATNPEYAWAEDIVRGGIVSILGSLGLATYGAVKKDEKIKKSNRED
jgi:hypothetical protein